MESIQLTPEEREAKDYWNTLFTAFDTPADESTVADQDTELPPWYDEAKFKRGQKYYKDNRFGILQAAFCSLLVLLADPKGLRILEHTGKSSTAETARKRYVSTLKHLSEWYECDLEPGSRSWKSLQQVRRMHLGASRSATKRQLGFISQPEMALTTFGFMGFPLVRPHLLGIRYDNREDREAFIHLWAVIGYMLGVHDRCNMCLFRLEVVDQICRIAIRYVFMPSLQLETTLYKQMVGAITDGYAGYMPFTSYESVLFLTRRLIGIPGYQYALDLKKEIICRPILTKAELESIVEHMAPKDCYRPIMAMYRTIFCEQIRLFKVKDLSNAEKEINGNYMMPIEDVSGTYTKINNNEDDCNGSLKGSEADLRQLLGLKHNQELIVTNIDNEDEWSTHLNDSQLKQLSLGGQHNVKVIIQMLNLCYNTVGRYVNETMLSFLLYRLNKLYT
uniref:ER-bound oxygenase mpaB/mpaB'/Rubber oxygenase catalytic domain-containing protein n=1 Tax=Anopheles triannulatus TaxID=58253 RepID=A0A2M4A901_9DIPT